MHCSMMSFTISPRILYCSWSVCILNAHNHSGISEEQQYFPFISLSFPLFHPLLPTYITFGLSNLFLISVCPHSRKYPPNSTALYRNNRMFSFKMMYLIHIQSFIMIFTVGFIGTLLMCNNRST